MTAALALLNLVLGTAYVGYGVLTLMDMKQGWRERGFSHFGAAWVFMAFTCGPHHLAHGIHLGFEGRGAGALDLLTVGVGLPVGIIWLWLRIEAFQGGRGDRFISGTPVWFRALPVAAAIYLTVLIVGGTAVVRGSDNVSFTAMIVPNLMLLWIYGAIGYLMWRTQLRNRGALGGWSVSGASLATVFPTCALMHSAWAIYAVAGTYHPDVHGFTIDWLAVPGALYFLWVVSSLYRGTLADWNQSIERRLGEVAPVM